MRLIVAGGRDYQFTEGDIAFLDKVAPAITEVVSGGATGADRCGEEWASKNGIPVKVFPADWDTHGKAAGPLRNRQMAEYAQGVILFPGGAGTASMHREAAANGLYIVDRRRKRG
jgi:hypothetical protein